MSPGMPTATSAGVPESSWPTAMEVLMPSPVWAVPVMPAVFCVQDLFPAVVMPVFVDGKLILDDWKEARAFVGFAPVTLTAGPHKVVVARHGSTSFLGTRFRS